MPRSSPDGWHAAADMERSHAAILPAAIAASRCPRGKSVPQEFVSIAFDP